jgi:hypothetical protein
MKAPQEDRWVKTRSVLWAMLWSALFTALIFQARASDFCYVRLRNITELWIAWSGVGLLLLVFFLLRNRGRLIYLIACILFLVLVVGHVDSIPAAAVEAQSVSELRSLVRELGAAREKHPAEGFPSTLPRTPAERISRLYKISYQTFTSAPRGPADRFLLEVTTLYRECGCIRSFAAAEDGEIHFTLEDRPATTADATLSQAYTESSTKHGP